MGSGEGGPSNQGYDLLNDDPGAYSDGEDFDGFCPDREWPDEELASHPAPVSTPQPTPAPSPAFTASELPGEEAPGVSSPPG